jgi:CRISPR/Cas system-associated protein Csm6
MTKMLRTIMEKADERNSAAMNLVAQSFQELKRDSSNIVVLLEKIIEMQTTSSKTEKNVLKEIRQMNQYFRGSEKGGMPKAKN